MRENNLQKMLQMRCCTECTKQKIKKFCLVFAYFFVTFIFGELAIRELTWGITSARQIASILLLCASSALLLASIALCVPKKFFWALIALLTICIVLLYAIQLCYFCVFNTFATLGVLLDGTDAVTHFFSIVSGAIKSARLYLLFIATPLVFLFLLGIFATKDFCMARAKNLACKKTPCAKKLRATQKAHTTQKAYMHKFFYNVAFVCTACLASFVLFLTALFCTRNMYTGAFASYTSLRATSQNVSTLGVVHSFLLDALYLSKTDNFVKKAHVAFVAKLVQIANNNARNSTAQIASDNLGNAQDLSTKKYDAQKGYYDPALYNVLQIPFDKLLQDDASDAVHEIDAYFASLVPDKKNEYTGLFAGNNLIYLTAESFSPHFISKEFTPTLYKMIHEGFYFENFYNPYWELSTTDGEYVNCLSLVPKSGTYSFKDSCKNALPFALGNQFAKLGYTTRAYHNYVGTYYDRNLTHPNLGYKFVSMGDGYRETRAWPDSDKEMIELTIEDYINNEPFHAYYMTISGHLPYNFYANAMSIRNKDKVEHLPYEEAVQAFFACNLELEFAMQYLLEKLQQKGIAQNTVIVLAADHYPYGLKPKQIRDFTGKNLDTTFELYKSPLIIYKDGMQATKIDKYCSNMDILPTICNLFALNYDSRLFMGSDILGTAEPFVIFESKNVITNKYKYYGEKNVLEPLNKEMALGNAGANFFNGVITEQNLQQELAFVQKTLQQKILYSSYVLDYDYYRRIQSAVQIDANGADATGSDANATTGTSASGATGAGAGATGATSAD